MFLSGTLIGAVMFAMLMSNMFLLPVFMQELLGFTAMQSGMALMPRTLVMMVAMPHRGAALQPGLAAADRSAFGVLLFAFGAYHDEPLHARDRAGGRRRRRWSCRASASLPVRAAHHRRARRASRATSWPTRPGSTRCCGRSAARSAWRSSPRCIPRFMQAKATHRGGAPDRGRPEVVGAPAR